MPKLVINNDKKMSTIAPEIYGHFSEHLGRCIYFALASPSLLEESVCTKTNPFDGKCDLLSGSDTRKECGAASGISEQYEEQY